MEIIPRNLAHNVELLASQLIGAGRWCLIGLFLLFFRLSLFLFHTNPNRQRSRH
jgi:hypothetical protein